MGLVISSVSFEGSVPELSRMAQKVAELSGLSVTAEESSEDVKGDLYDLHAQLAFACVPGERLELRAYRPAGVKEFWDRTFGEAALPVAKFVEGLNEPAGTQAVHLRCYVGQEPTLFYMTLLALEALGGRPRHPIGEDVRREYGTPITVAHLEGRRRKVRKQLRHAAMIGLLMLPILIPIWLIGILKSLATTPDRLRQARERCREYIEDRGKSV